MRQGAVSEKTAAPEPEFDEIVQLAMQVCEVIAWPGRDWEPRLKARHTL